MDVLSQVAQNNAARSEAAKYNADREAVAHWNAVQSAKQAEAGRVLNQAPSTPVEGLAAKLGYSDGSLEDAYKLQLVKQAQDANRQRSDAQPLDPAVVAQINKNRDYNATKNALAQREADARAYDGPGGGGGFDDALIFNPIDRAAVKKYQDSIDPVLAAKWMADRGAFK